MGGDGDSLLGLGTLSGVCKTAIRCERQVFPSVECLLLVNGSCGMNLGGQYLETAWMKGQFSASDPMETFLNSTAESIRLASGPC